jgi:hypothetical protein
MNNLKTVLRIGGIVIAVMGLMFLPSRNLVFDKGDLSAFSNWADVGVFVRSGFGLIVVGLVVFGLSFLVRGDMTD